MSPSSLTTVRHCKLNILASPGIANAFDPREAKNGEWPLRDAVFMAMRQMTSLQDMSLNIQATGGLLWNPVWLWHFTTQAFKKSDVKAFGRIDFTMKDWNLREPNHLARGDGDGWEWRCRDGHLVRVDDEGEQAIRDFCSCLYSECEVCEEIMAEGGTEGGAA